MIGPNDALPRTAIHEAGHAVVALALGRELDAVHLLPQPGGVAGVTRLVGQPEGPDGLAIVLAGDMAASLARAGHPVPERPRAVPWLWTHRARQTAERVDMARCAPAHVADGERVASAAPTAHELSRAQARAREILTAQWPAAYAVARLLLEEGQLAGARLQEVWRAHGGVRVSTEAAARTVAEPLGGGRTLIGRRAMPAGIPAKYLEPVRRLGGNGKVMC